VVYSALWEGRSQEIFTTRIENPEARSMGLPPGLVLGVSSQGVLAILVTSDTDRQAASGKLAVVPLSGGAPRDLLEEIHDASWAPDGKNLCVVRWHDDRWSLEFPIGKVLYGALEGVGSPRVSPRGDLIAFQGGEGRGAVHVVDMAGRVTTLTRPYADLYGL